MLKVLLSHRIFSYSQVLGNRGVNTVCVWTLLSTPDLQFLFIPLKSVYIFLWRLTMFFMTMMIMKMVEGKWAEMSCSLWPIDKKSICTPYNLSKVIDNHYTIIIQYLSLLSWLLFGEKYRLPCRLGGRCSTLLYFLMTLTSGNSFHFNSFRLELCWKATYIVGHCYR